MKKSLIYFAVLIALNIFADLNANVSAQTAPRVGGYKEVSTTNAEVAAAAKFAASAQAKKIGGKIKLISIESAESQVVAGTNYRMCLKVETEDPNEDVTVVQTVKTVVYRNLKKVYALKNWAEEDCAGSEESN